MLDWKPSINWHNRQSCHLVNNYPELSARGHGVVCSMPDWGDGRVRLWYCWVDCWWPCHLSWTPRTPGQSSQLVDSASTCWFCVRLFSELKLSDEKDDKIRDLAESENKQLSHPCDITEQDFFQDWLIKFQKCCWVFCCCKNSEILCKLIPDVDCHYWDI